MSGGRPADHQVPVETVHPRPGWAEQDPAAWEAAAEYSGDFIGMSAQEFSDQTYWSIRALLSLGRTNEAIELTGQVERYALDLIDTPARIDFFATSLPSLLIFHDDPNRARHALAQNLLDQVASLRSRPVDQVRQ